MNSKRRQLTSGAPALAAGSERPVRADSAAVESLVVLFSVEGAKNVRKASEAFTAATGVQVVIETPDGIKTKFQQAASAGKGPDICTFPHDRIGEWLAGGLLHAVTPSAALREDIDDMAWRGVRWRGRTCGYPCALAGLRFQFRRRQLTSLMLMQMFPAVLALVAIYAIFDRLGAALPAIGLNTHASLVLAYSGGIAMPVWTLKGYYDTLPVEVEEAARVDGATRWQTFWPVLLPMAKPMLAMVFLLSFIGAIIEHPVASVQLSQQDQFTLAVGAKLFVYEHKVHWGDFAAAALLSGLPITAVFLLAQRWLTAGLAAGGVKG
jgi:ABC-type spermidine/putrescine transport system permease subunit II